MQRVNLHFLRNNATSWKLFQGTATGTYFEFLDPNGKKKVMTILSDAATRDELLKKLEKTKDIVFLSDKITHIDISDSKD